MTPTGFIRLPYVDGPRNLEMLVNAAHVVSVAPNVTGSTLVLSTYTAVPGYPPPGLLRTPMSYNAVVEAVADAVGGWRPNSAYTPSTDADTAGEVTT